MDTKTPARNDAADTRGARPRPVIAGRYRLVREIGRGGMGVVWLACDEVLGREVALKRVGFLPGEASPDLARAEREARLAASLNHPHVVAVFDLARHEDEQWLVMEYVEGATLAEIVRQRGPLAPDVVAPLLRQVADALATAHRAGIVHRDVKPSNILVTADNQVKLADFGIARIATDPSVTQTGLVTGSPAYLSPEVASGQSGGAPSDVWALGATLFHALTGRPPYDVSGNVLGALYQIVHEEPPQTPRAGWLGPVLEGMMTRDIERRWDVARVRDYLAEGPAHWDASATAVIPEVPQHPGNPHFRTFGSGSQSLPVAAPAAPPLVAAMNPAPSRWSSQRVLQLAGVVLLALALTGLVGSLLGDGEPSAPAASANGAGASESEQRPTEETKTDAPTDMDDAAMRAFVQDYLATVTEDPATAWGMLSRSFQAQSGGFGGYRGFWGTIRSATPSAIQTDPATRTVSYSVDYVRTDGTRLTDAVRLELASTEDGLQIVDEG